MKAKQLYFILVACCILGVIACAVVGYGANKLLAAHASKLSDLRALNAAAEQQQTSLAQDKKDVTKYSDLNTIAASIVPQDKDQAAAVRQIVNIAAASGITQLSSIAFPSSSLGANAVGTPTSSKPGLTQLAPVTGITGVYNLQLTITQKVGVPYSSFIKFLSGLEQNRRTAEVTSISIAPDSTSPNAVVFTLVVNEFIKP